MAVSRIPRPLRVVRSVVPAEAAAAFGRRLTVRSTTGTPNGAVLVLHGGREESREPARWYHPGVLRAKVLAWSLHRSISRHGIDVWFLHHRLRGWNDRDLSAVTEARRALRVIGAAGAAGANGSLPVVLVGHSMGGRTAFRVADEENVIGAIGLAPWVPKGEPVEPVRGKHVRIGHGSADRVTSPKLSRAFADRAEGTAASVGYQVVDGDGHALLRRFTTWTKLMAEGSLQMLATRVGRVG